MTKRIMTEAQFAEAIKGLNVSPQTLEIAHGVLVLGRTQKHYAQELELTEGAISQSVRRVWQNSVPSGCERVTVVLPAHQAFIVKKWEQALKNTES